MYWIKAQDGRLVNLALAIAVRAINWSPTRAKGKYEVQARFNPEDFDDTVVLFSGTKEECEQYLEGLWEDLGTYTS